MGRLSHGPGSAASGQVPSLREPRISDVGLLQAGFEGSPDGEAGMHRHARTHVLASDQAAIEIGVVARRHLDRRHGVIEQTGEEQRRRLARFALPQRRGKGRRRCGVLGCCRARVGDGHRGQRLGDLDVRAGEGRERPALMLRKGGDQRRESDLQAGDQLARALPVVLPQTAHGGLAAVAVGFLDRRALERRCDASQPAAEVGRAECRDFERARRAAHGRRRRGRAASADASRAPSARRARSRRRPPR